jgi:hypothetical protein
MSEIWRFSEENARAADCQEAMDYLNDAMAISVLSNLTAGYPAACACPPRVYCHHKAALDGRARGAVAGVTGAAVTGVALPPVLRPGETRPVLNGRPLATGHIADEGITCGCDDCVQSRRKTRGTLAQRELEKLMAAELAEAEAEERKYGHPDGCGCEPCVALWWRRTTALMRRPDPQLLRPGKGTCGDCGWELPPDSAAYCFYCTRFRELGKGTACGHGKREQCPACYPPGRPLRQREGRGLSPGQRISLVLMAAGFTLVLAGLLTASVATTGIGAALMICTVIWRL